MRSFSMHISAIFSDEFSLALNICTTTITTTITTTTTTTTTTIETIIIDRLLIKGKWRGELVSTRENRNMQVSKLRDKQMMS